MPKYDWDVISPSMTNRDAQILGTFKSHKIRGSQKVTCNICRVAKAHKMRERRYTCTSGACAVATAGVDCPWHGKALFCEVLGVVSIFERKRPPCHRCAIAEANSFHDPSLRKQHLRPARILFSMRRRFDLDEQSLPSLAKVQRFVNYFVSLKLGCNDFYDEILDKVRSSGYSNVSNDASSYKFTWRVDRDGKPVVGIGSDEDSFFW